MHEEIIPRPSRRAITYLSGQTWLKRSSWYLAGGTALALQAGHRHSLDFDFFTPKSSFSTASVVTRFPKEEWETEIAREGTIYGKLFGAKVSFIAYPFFRPKEPLKYYGMIPVLSADDVAVMKIIAISQRGKKRDFIDLYWYCTNKEPLIKILHKLPEQYPSVAHDYHHIIKSLLYFDDAEGDPMPRLFFKADWKTVKAFFRREVPGAAKTLLRLP